MEQYSKFIFMATSKPAPRSAPSTAPPVSPDAKAAALKKKAADRLRAKKGMGKGKEKVYQAWLNNNPKGNEVIIEDDAKDLVLWKVGDPSERERAYVLFGMVEKFMGGKKEAVKLFWKAYNKSNNTFDVDVVRAHFTKERCKNSGESVGFYYGTRKIMWNYGSWTTQGRMRKRLDKTGFKYEHVSDPNSNTTYAYNVSVTGWWAWDQGEDNNNYFNNDDYSPEKGFLNRLKGGGNGDEWCGKDIITALSSSSAGLNKELKTQNQRMQLPADEREDSNLAAEREENIKKELNRLVSAQRGLGPEKTKKEILAWFKKMKPDQWVKLNEEANSKMAAVYGPGCSSYKYRYVPEKNRIYFMRIDKTPIHPTDGKFGYLLINKDGTLNGKWNVMKEPEFKKAIFKDVIDDMPPEKVKKALRKHEAAASSSPSINALLGETVGKLKSIVKKVPMKYSALNADYYERIEKKLKEKLIKDRTPADNAKKQAAARIEKFKKDVDKWLTDHSAIKDQLEASKEKIITLTVDSDDKVDIKPRDNAIAKLGNAVSGAANLALDKAKNLKDAVESEYTKIMENAGFFGSILGFFTDIKADIKEYLKPGGKKGMILGLLMMMSGAKLSRRMITAVPISDLSQLQQLAKKNGGKLSDDLRIKKPQTLKGLKIVIPKNKGIVPGGAFKVKVKGLAGKQDVSPKKARAVAAAKAKAEGGKKKGGVGGMFGGMLGGISKMVGGLFGGKGKETGTGPMFEHAEITIEPNTILPPGTYIPKGAKISVA